MPQYDLTNTLGTFHHPDNYKAMLDVEDSEKYLLFVGPGITRSTTHAPSSLHRLLESMVSWCIRERTMSQYDTIEDFREQYGGKALLRNTLIQLGYTLEENLCEKQQQRDGLKAALGQYTQSGEGEIYRLLVCKPLRGYVTTAYDTFIETAYAKERQEPLLKFYTSTIGGAIEACRSGQPFILKLYGDIDDPASIVLGSRFTKGISGIREQEQLRLLLSMSPALFIGFEEADPDLEALSAIARMPDISSHSALSWLVPPSEQTPKFEVGHVWKYSGYDSIHEAIKDYVTSIPLPETLMPLRAVIKSSPRTTPSPTDTQETQPSPATPKAKNASAIEIFTVYVPADEPIRKGIETVLSILQKQNWRLICNWGRASIKREWERGGYLETAHLILLLVSQDFLNTEFCYSDQIKSAVKRLEKEDRCCIIPIIGRSTSNELLVDAPFGHLPFLPQDGKPVIGRKDRACAEIGAYIKQLLESWRYY